MTETPPTPQPGSPNSPTPPGASTRSTSDRLIAGVAGGIGRHLDIDPLAIRITFVILTFAGGLGILAYLACLVFVPTDDPDAPPLQLGPGPDGRRRPARGRRPRDPRARLGLGPELPLLLVGGRRRLPAAPRPARRRRADAGRRRGEDRDRHRAARARRGRLRRGRGGHGARRRHRRRRPRHRLRHRPGRRRVPRRRALADRCPRSCSRSRSARSPRPTSTCAARGASARFIPATVAELEDGYEMGRRRDEGRPARRRAAARPHRRCRLEIGMGEIQVLVPDGRVRDHGRRDLRSARSTPGDGEQGGVDLEIDDGARSPPGAPSCTSIADIGVGALARRRPTSFDWRRGLDGWRDDVRRPARPRCLRGRG